VTVGNEVGGNPNDLMNKVYAVRGYLNNAGYKGPVSTVSIWVDVIKNPILCNGDRVTVNAHPFYDGNVQAAGAGNFIRDIVLPAIKKACAPYPAVNNIVITESGWPSRGGNYGSAVPSLENERAALNSLNRVAKNIKIVAFEADDSVWKKAGNDNEKSKSSANSQV
jgi:exo-beta-1,3-glucanase (GH17 family)